MKKVTKKKKASKKKSKLTINLAAKKKETAKIETLLDVQNCRTKEGQDFTMSFTVNTKVKKPTIKSLQEELQHQKDMVQSERKSLHEIWEENSHLKNKLAKSEGDRNLYYAVLALITRQKA